MVFRKKAAAKKAAVDLWTGVVDGLSRIRERHVDGEAAVSIYELKRQWLRKYRPRMYSRLEDFWLCPCCAYFREVSRTGFWPVDNRGCGHCPLCNPYRPDGDPGNGCEAYFRPVQQPDVFVYSLPRMSLYILCRDAVDEGRWYDAVRAAQDILDALEAW